MSDVSLGEYEARNNLFADYSVNKRLFRTMRKTESDSTPGTLQRQSDVCHLLLLFHKRHCSVVSRAFSCRSFSTATSGVPHLLCFIFTSLGLRGYDILQRMIFAVPTTAALVDSHVFSLFCAVRTWFYLFFLKIKADSLTAIGLPAVIVLSWDDLMT
jgi:hypothetical protein